MEEIVICVVCDLEGTEPKHDFLWNIYFIRCKKCEKLSCNTCYHWDKEYCRNCYNESIS